MRVRDEVAERALLLVAAWGSSEIGSLTSVSAFWILSSGQLVLAAQVCDEILSLQQSR